MAKGVSKRDLKMIAVGFRGGFACSAGILGESSGVTRYRIAQAIESLGMNETVTTMLASDMVQDALTVTPDKKRWASMMRELMAIALDPKKPHKPSCEACGDSGYCEECGVDHDEVA